MKSSLKILAMTLAVFALVAVALVLVNLGAYGITSAMGVRVPSAHCKKFEKVVSWKLSQTSYAFYERKASGREFIGIHEEHPWGTRLHSYMLYSGKIEEQIDDFAIYPKEQRRECQAIPQEFSKLLLIGKARMIAFCK